MEITLVRANIQDAENLWKMQIAAFQDLYAKYQDHETSPATETLEKTILRLEQPYTYFYYINVEDSIIGAMRVIDHKEEGKYKFLSHFHYERISRTGICSTSDAVGRRDSRKF